MAVNVPIEGVFEGTNGRYYTGRQVERRLRTGAWMPCIQQRNPDRLLVEVADGALLMLAPIEPTDLPSWTEIRIDGRGARVVDTRRPIPE
ncbi:hypothetical protein [Halosolutus gelatinilyticus]|uniref:hypothetical protein n=1 Tax=Halosolutus gelatinilyticus TaxID=2931975 RepID=UPI001FF50733|nr:hypothetical protein [Halosolutus gelatinilyticus]